MTEWTGTISMKRIRKLGYLFKEGVRNMFTHGFMSFAAICVTVACLVIIGSFSSILYNLSRMVRTLERENQITAFIDDSYDEQTAKTVETAIRRLDNIREANFVSREEAGRRFIEQQGGGEAYQGIDEKTFTNRVVITLEDNSKMAETKALIEQIHGVDHVNAREELAEGFTTIQRVLNIASAAIILILLIVSLFMISNTIKLAMYDRRDEIGIMKMVGATNRFIRFPYMVEGFLIGVIAAALAFFIDWGIYNLIAKQIQNVDALKLFDIVPFSKLLLPMIATFGAAGLFVGIFGSVMSIRKFLDV